MKQPWNALSWALIVFVVVVVMGECSQRDDTDPASGRSGMGLRIDNRTGCHYLTSVGLFGESAITPRLDREGRHICQPQGASHDQ